MLLSFVVNIHEFCARKFGLLPSNNDGLSRGGGGGRKVYATESG